jgi:hypothetical protein
MRQRMLALSAFCVVLTATTGVGAGASAAPNNSSTYAFGAHIPKSGGTVHLSAFSDNDGPTSSLVLTGVIGDYGRAVRVTSTGSTMQGNELLLRMSRGSFRLDIAGLESKLLADFNSDFPTNGTTCSGFEVVAGKAPIVSGTGTRAYKGLHGIFDLIISVNEVEKWPTCPKDDTSPYLAQTVYVAGSGLVNLSS